MRRYGAVWRHAWQERKAMDGPKRDRHEAAFLPASLSLQETPVHPAPRVAIWLILLFALIALLWALLGRIEIVAVAPGRIVASDRSKVIQPLEAATVKAIFVTDGQAVRAGEPLIELDATVEGADVMRIVHDLAAARLGAGRARAMLSAIDSAGAPRLAPVPEVDHERHVQEQRMLEGQHAEYRAKLAKLDAEIERRQAELRSNGELVEKLAQTAPIARERAQNYKDLLEKNFISRHGYLDREKERIELEQDLAVARAKVAEINAALLESRRLKSALIAETRRIALDELNEAELKAAELAQERVKAERRQTLMRLTAPVDGAVQQLAIHTVGGVVTPAQPLMIIVPRDNPVEVDAQVANKDIGFVRPEQHAEVKVETFPFTRYGTIPATVSFVSNDAISDEKLGLIYQARVRLARATMQVEGKWVNLSPGMAVTVEIKTGTRRVIEYFLSPFLQYRDESLRER
jgi:hemolysin D